MANKIVVAIPTTTVESDLNLTSDAVALGPNESGYSASLLISDRTDGTATLTVQTSVFAEGPWVTWFALSGASSDGLSFNFPTISESSTGLLFARLSLASTSVTTGLDVQAQLMCRESK